MQQYLISVANEKVLTSKHDIAGVCIFRYLVPTIVKSPEQSYERFTKSSLEFESTIDLRENA